MKAGRKLRAFILGTPLIDYIGRRNKQNNFSHQETILKKTVLALASLAALGSTGTAFAQSNVTIYGLIDATISSSMTRKLRA